MAKAVLNVHLPPNDPFFSGLDRLALPRELIHFGSEPSGGRWMAGGHREQVLARNAGPQEGAKLGGQRERGVGER